ncbi:LysR substrate-binding domain-containing protein, partial [Enterovirga sp. CN4-39]|uniref:LysR family transcriptional regulator n=1 Tax=Enterovirga sp. CN4-39 TaxID=3400910 RepID=UPI003C000521
MLHEIDLSRVDLNLFVLFEAVLSERHVGRAAERLNLSPSAVSHGLGRLRLLLKDPVFLRTPKGVTPTARALEVASQVEQLLSQARGVLATAAPFDPATSQREFTIGAPDGVASLYLLPLFAKLRRDAPGINIRMRQLLPTGGRAIEQAWDGAFTDLDARALDLAIGPFATVPNRFEVAELGIESFVIIARSGHSFAKRPSLDAYCEADHLVVSQSGDAHGFVDVSLAELGRARRVALTVPAFAMALTIVAETDLLSAVPRSFAEALGSPAGVVLVEPPLS